jgi:hypothetical protein
MHCKRTADLIEPQAPPGAERKPRGLAPGPDEWPSCDLCAGPLEYDHMHVVELETRRVLCACTSCGELFEGAGEKRRYRTVQVRTPRRVSH